MIVFLALAMLFASPPEVTYLNPPIIIIITAATPTIIDKMLMTCLITALRSLVLPAQVPPVNTRPLQASCFEFANVVSGAACVTVAGVSAATPVDMVISVTISSEILRNILPPIINYLKQNLVWYEPAQ